MQCMQGAPRGAPWDFEAELFDAFDREIFTVESELHSQLHLSRSSICRLGRESQENFDQAVPKIYGWQLSDEHREILFAAYVKVTLKVDQAHRSGQRGPPGQTLRPTKTSLRPTRSASRSGRRGEASLRLLETLKVDRSCQTTAPPCAFAWSMGDPAYL